MGLPQCLSGKESVCNTGDMGRIDLIPGLGRSPGGGNGYPLQDSCLENSIDRGVWQAIVHGGHKELDMTERLVLYIIPWSINYAIALISKKQCTHLNLEDFIAKNC